MNITKRAQRSPTTHPVPAANSDNTSPEQQQPSGAATIVTRPKVSSLLHAEPGYDAEAKELRSNNGRFRFVVQDDGSLVLYMDSDAIWAIYQGSASPPVSDDLATRLFLQGDGNLFVVHRARGVIWASNTARADIPGPFKLMMQDDGNCVLYDGHEEQRWSTKTSGWG